MCVKLKDIEKFVGYVSSKSSSAPFYHCYGKCLSVDACKFCPFFIDVDGDYVTGICQGMCADLYVMRYLQ